MGKNKMSTSKKLSIAGGFLAGIIVVGIVGYMLIEGWNFMDAFYMTVISITTTGIQDSGEILRRNWKAGVVAASR